MTLGRGPKKLLAMLEKRNAVIYGSHFVYTSGKHGSSYVNKRALYPYPQYVECIGRNFAKYFLLDKIEVVVGPAMGGIMLAQRTADILGKKCKRQIFSLFAEKNSQGQLEFCNEFASFLEDRKVLIVEDIINTGSSVKQVIEQVRQHQGIIGGVICLVNRGKIQNIDLGLPPDTKFISLCQIPMRSYDPDECPFCKAKVPINTSVGKGKEFLEKQAPK